MNDREMQNEAHLELTSDVVSAYVSNNPVPHSDVSALIASVSAAFVRLRRSEGAEAPTLEPAVNPKRSVHADYVVCLEDGRKFRSLKRHLSTHHGMTPDEYRAKWSLPADYPMVAPSYAAARSRLAKKMGLGRKPKAGPAQASQAATAEQDLKPKTA